MKTNIGTDVIFEDSSAGYTGSCAARIEASPGRDRNRAGAGGLRNAVPSVTPIGKDNNAAFETIVQRLTPTLRRIAGRLDGNFSFIDRHDLFQETLVHLWTHFTSGELHDKTDSYMLQGCYFHLKNYIRKTRDSASFVSLSHTADEEGPLPEEVFDARSLASYDGVEGNLQIDAMEKAGITEREKEVLLSCLEGMTTREIGKKLGISHVSVVKIRNKIKEKYVKLNDMGPQDADASASVKIRNKIKERYARLNG